ncbi:MAG: NUDIX domain-containing protein [Candidatus Altimarinota bacterium]
MENPWKKKSERIVYENPWIKVREDQIINPSGNPGIYGVVEIKHVEVDVVAVQDRTLYLVRQFLYPVGKPLITVVSGGVHEGEDLELAAKRELKEEAGLICKKLDKLASYYVGCGVMKAEVHAYLARDLQEGDQELDETEKIEVLKMDVDEGMEMLEKDEIKDSSSIIALQKYYLGRLKGIY